MKLTRCKLGKVLELQRGYDLPSSQMEKGDILVAGSNGVIGYHNEARSNHPCITVGRSGSVGKVHYYEQATWAHNTALFVKDFKGNDPKYLYYFLKNLRCRKYKLICNILIFSMLFPIIYMKRDKLGTKFIQK